MKKISIITGLATCALLIVPTFLHTEAAPPAEVCYKVICRGTGSAHKAMVVVKDRVCASTDAAAQSAARDAMQSHRGIGHAPTMVRLP